MSVFVGTGGASRLIVEFRGVTKSYGARVVLPALDLAVIPGEFLTLLGPSGCGKTTLLRLLAGFETPDSGEVWLEGINITDQPANLRPVNTVFQSYALFPHLSVFDNIAFGLRLQKLSRSVIAERVEEMLTLVQLVGYARHKPHQLSGGQQQRVALARALVNNPRVLLLDECLSALDAKLRQSMQIELKNLQQRLQTTFIFVTHDQEEALAMSDRIAVMDHGQILQLGTPQEIYSAPANRHVAQFMGQGNLLAGQVVQVNHTDMTIMIDDVPYTVKGKFAVVPGEQVQLFVRPEHVHIEEVTSASAHGLIGRILATTYRGMTQEIVVELTDGTRLVACDWGQGRGGCLRNYALGQPVTVSWSSDVARVMVGDASH